MMSSSDSLKEGKRILQILRGGETKDEFLDRVENLCPDWARMTQGHLFGEVWSRPGLSLRERSMITIAVLVIHGHNDLGLKVQMEFALNLGISREEIFEIIMHATHYGGWPCGANAMRLAMEVFSTKNPVDTKGNR
jgi:4-carboxymuconolactone decarboxylase